MRKIQIRLFDNRRNQQFWFHFCYLPNDVWERYFNTFKVANMDVQIKKWLQEDFELSIENMNDLYVAKNAIKKMYASKYPTVFIDSPCDRQGWARVWLTDKVNKLLEEVSNG